MPHGRRRRAHLELVRHGQGRKTPNAERPTRNAHESEFAVGR
jgi:hypothetical protein